MGGSGASARFFEDRQIPIPESRARSVVEATNQLFFAVSLLKRPFGAVGEVANGLGLSTGPMKR